jgi:hypothetical protein
VTGAWDDKIKLWSLLDDQSRMTYQVPPGLSDPSVEIPQPISEPYQWAGPSANPEPDPGISPLALFSSEALHSGFAVEAWLAGESPR